MTFRLTRQRNDQFHILRVLVGGGNHKGGTQKKTGKNSIVIWLGVLYQRQKGSVLKMGLVECWWKGDGWATPVAGLQAKNPRVGNKMDPGKKIWKVRSELCNNS